jgi:LPXTG-site transpeptidase (sortase) family protein
MSASRRSQEATVPLGVVFITVGVFILLVVGGLWFLASQQRPAQAEGIGPTLMPLAATVGLPTATVMTTAGDSAVPVLLPETSLQNNFPSFASPEEAPLIPTDAPVAGQPTRLVIPAIDVDAPVQAVSLEVVELSGQNFFQWQVPNSYVAGWHDSSALLGQPGNTVLNGHHNIHGEVFRDLINLAIGDQVIIYDQERPYSYRVSQAELLPESDQPASVRQTNAHWIQTTADERITLVTCWPYTGNSHRLVVVAVPSQ